MVDFCCEEEEISRCEGDESVPLDLFTYRDIVREIDRYEKEIPWDSFDTFKVIEINDGRYAWVAHYTWGTCSHCEGESTEVIVSDDLELLWRFALTDEARNKMSKLYNELF